MNYARPDAVNFYAFILGVLLTVTASSPASENKIESEAVSVSEATRCFIELDTGWRFHLGTTSNSFCSNTFDDKAWDQVSLPHTWNAFDGQDGGGNYVRGEGCYRKHFEIPTKYKGKKVFLECDAASRQAEVFVNGHFMGKHNGAFARFRFDITDYILIGTDNILAIKVDNSKSDMVPLGGDYTQCGGLYRKVRLLITEPVHIATLDYASSGIYLSQKNVTSESAEVDARVKITNQTAKLIDSSLRITIQSPDGIMVKSAVVSSYINQNTTNEIKVPFKIENPHRWNGLADPYVYHVRVDLLSKGKILDSVTEPLGLRSYSVNPQTGFYLNESSYPLHGVNRHQDRFDKGWAITDNDQKEDFSILTELGANAVRLVHYQHDQLFYNLCDQGGIGVWAELCFSKSPPKTGEGFNNAKDQLRELIRQNYNHPSILFWSIGNETTEQGGTADNLLRELAEIVKQEDPSRLSVYASHHLPEDPRNFHSDILAVNKYFGWYHGTYSDLGIWLDAFHKSYPTRVLGISEYGAGASIYQHEDNPPVRNSQSRGLWHPEEWQARFHEENWLQIKQRPYLWGTFIWALFDLASDGRDDGDRSGINDKGLVTQDRQNRKDAFYWYKANWTTNPMVHITSKRYTDRSVSHTDIKIYSNATEVDLMCNGIDIGHKKSNDCRFIWPDFILKTGLNRIEAIAFKDGKVVATDSACWIYRKPGEGVPILINTTTN